MTIDPIVPDVASPATRPGQNSAPSAMGEFGKVLNDLGSVLTGASRAEDAFAQGSGDLQSAIYERARADVALAVATAAAGRAAQALQSIFNMQV